MHRSDDLSRGARRDLRVRRIGGSRGRNLVIDGCPVACGLKIFERLALPAEQYVMTDFGVQKGKTPITDAVVGSVSRQVRDRIAAASPATIGAAGSAADRGGPRRRLLWLM